MSSKERRRIALHRAKARVLHPPPLWKRAGGVTAVVTRADGRVEDLGVVSDVYTRRWSAGTE